MVAKLKSLFPETGLTPQICVGLSRRRLTLLWLLLLLLLLLLSCHGVAALGGAGHSLAIVACSNSHPVSYVTSIE